jgi:phage tail sheath protein FI
VSSATSAALEAHCASTNRLGLVTVAAGTTAANAIVAAAAVASGENLALVWPHVKATTNAGTLTIEPTGLALGARARAHAAEGPWASPVRDVYGKAKWVTDLYAGSDTTAAQWLTLNEGNVSVVRTSNGSLRLYGWRSIDAPDGVTNLQAAQHRDTINRVAVGCQRIAEEFVGRTVDGKGLVLGEFAGQLTGFLASMSGGFYAGADDPGWVVDVGPGVNTTANLAAGDVAAAVGVRLAPSAEFITIRISATDASGAI